MRPMNFWHDHPLWLRRFVRPNPWRFIPIHVGICYVALAVLLPWSGALNAVGLATWGPIGFFLSAGAVMILVLVGYLIAFLPVRVLGGEELVAYLCIFLSPAFGWNLLY